MFALGIRYLNGWTMATHPADRNLAEWPPHPDRVFMALAAGYFETAGSEEERQVLEWLQSLPAPALKVGNASQREIVISYVPVNDTEISRPKNDSQQALQKRIGAFDSVSTLSAAKDKGLALLPENRSRQARSFPVAIPDADDSKGMPRVLLIWAGIDVPESKKWALESLCAKVISIGHPASLVQMWIEPSPPAANLVPLEGVTAKHRLRVTGDGRLDYLVSRYKAGLRPASSLWQGYDEPMPKAIEPRRSPSCFDSNLVVLRRIEATRLGLESTLQLTEAVRKTVMSLCPVQPPPAWVSGHTTDGLPLQGPHLAFMPLPHVDHEHATGHLLGVAIVVPRDVSPTEQKRCLGEVLFDEQGVPRELEIRMGKIGVWQMTLDEDEDPRMALRTGTWTAAPAGAKRWATVTPIVFDRHPKMAGDVEQTIIASCERIGLPPPRDVITASVSMFVGSPHARRFPNMKRKTGGNLHHTHAILTFDQPVIGPVILGAGRYRGYGLCRPLKEGGEA